MSRNHIHMAAGHKGEVMSGMRFNCNLYIEIDIEKAMKDGIKFYVSENNVILSKGIDGILAKKYFKTVTNKEG